MISEELLAAFDEGKTNAEESLMIIKSIAEDKNLQEEYILSKKLDAIMGYDEEDIDVIPMTAMAADSEGNLCDFNVNASYWKTEELRSTIRRCLKRLRKTGG